VFCGIGFASVENVLYTAGFWESLGSSDAFQIASLLRFFLPFTMHILAGPPLLSGYVIQGFRPIAGVCIATMFHGLYDASLAAGLAPLVAVKITCFLLARVYAKN
jgi:hypothetical protein